MAMELLLDTFKTGGFYGLLCWNKLFDIRLFRDKGVHFDETMFFGDDASELHRVYDGEYVYCVPRVLYHYRRRGGQMTEVLFPPRRLDDLKMYWNWLGWFAAQPDKPNIKVIMNGPWHGTGRCFTCSGARPARPEPWQS